jgi:hypothetical protein
MSIDHNVLAALIAKDEIRELAQLYSRAVDRRDTALLRSLFTTDGTQSLGSAFQGTADELVAMLDQAMPYMRYTGHHVCNHLISVSGDRAEGEVYALVYHVLPDGKGGSVEDVTGVRYLDRYRKEHGRWRFAHRTGVFDFKRVTPIPTPEGDVPEPANDSSYSVLTSRLFARGPQARGDRSQQ